MHFRATFHLHERLTAACFISFIFGFLFPYMLYSMTTVKRMVVYRNWSKASTYDIGPTAIQNLQNRKKTKTRNLSTSMIQDMGFGYPRAKSKTKKAGNVSKIQNGPFKSNVQSETCQEWQVGQLEVLRVMQGIKCSLLH